MRFTEDHEWLHVENGVVVVGITGYAAEQLGDVVFVDLPETGTAVSKDEEIVVIESVKAASDILAPLDGEIIEVNTALADNPGLVNEDPMGAAWFFKMRIDNLAVVDEYMTEAAYQAHIGA
ncbi:MAG: glycine cleavage system protein GcvH [Rhodobacteraceae bacterium]|nr:glycine cleavage system protein GcvH [Paracoccaceae bacterium]